MICVEGVLAQHNPHLPSATPMPEAIELHRALAASWSLVLFSIEHSVEHIEYWCQRERLEGHLRVLTPVDEDKRPGQAREELVTILVTRARSKGHSLGLFVDSDPRGVGAATYLGVSSMLFVSPAYGRPEWLPDAAITPRPWDELVVETEERRSAHAGDGRLNLDKSGPLLNVDE